MKRKNMLISMAITFLVVSSLFFIAPTKAYDQQSQRVSKITNYPPGVTFYSIEWNQKDYSYALAVGNDSSDTSVVYRYWSTNSSWELLWKGGVGEKFYDVVYNTHLWNDTFFIIGDNGGESSAYILYEAGSYPPSPVIVDLGAPPPGSGFTAGCFEPNLGPEGTLIAVGTPYDTVSPIIAWHDMTWSPYIWEYRNLPKGEILEDVTSDYDPEIPMAIAVGYNTSTGRAVAYMTNYHDVYGLNVPSDAAKFHGIEWKPGDYWAYGIVVGENSAGYGKVWRIENPREVFYISYYNRTAGSESLKMAVGNRFSWNTYTIDSAQYAGYYTSIDLDPHGLPRISYWEGGSTSLKYAEYNGISWNLYTIDSDGQYTSIAIDSNGRPHISYYDETNNDLKYAYYSGSWQISVIDSSGDVGKYSSIALDSVGNPHISYYDLTNMDLKHAWYASGTWSTESVNPSTTFDAGLYTSIDIDSNNLPHISYSSTTDGPYYAYFDGSSWNTEKVSDGATGTFTSIALDWENEPHISAIDGGLAYFEYSSPSWSNKYIIDSSGNSYTSIEIGAYNEPCISYYDGDNKNLMFAYYDRGTWETVIVDSYGDVGDYSSLAIGMRVSYFPMKVPEYYPILYDISWEKSGNGAVIVGDDGKILVHYTGDNVLYDWSNSNIRTNFRGVGIKKASSPGYGIAVGSSGTFISYQIYDSSTNVGINAVMPHINDFGVLDKNLFDKRNQQIDVGTYYYLFINGSYSLGWDKVEIDIYGWFDQYDDSTQYNDTQGSNLNFHLHYTPDPVDPFNNSGTWTLLWPDSTNPSITLGDCIQQVEDNPSGGTQGQNDGQDYYLLFVNITFHEQVRYAPGDGTWDASANTSSPSDSFNDPGSWNFNITITDSSNGVSTTVNDEFGIYAYTEISVSNNPSGVGAPGNTIDLNPPSHVVVKSNRDYVVKVNITDLQNATGDRKILRDYVEVMNPTASNDASASYIYTWRSFTGNYPLYVWGNNQSGTVMPPLDYGTCSAGYNFGYDPTSTYTTIYWRITIPPTTPEDEYTAVVSFEITY